LARIDDTVINMPVKGYSSITVSSKLYERIRIEAENQSLSMPEYLNSIFDSGVIQFLHFVNRWLEVQTPSKVSFIMLDLNNFHSMMHFHMRKLNKITTS